MRLARKRLPAHRYVRIRSRSHSLTILNQALVYHQIGFSVLPLGKKSKFPYAELLPRDQEGNPSWNLLRDRPASEPEIRAWFDHEPDLNVGIITGGPSGNLVVLDFDTKELPSGIHLPPTLIAQTNRGRHYYYRSSSPIRKSSAVWGDVQGEGGYVVAPPSVHPNGARYEWQMCCSPEDIEVADLPDSLLQWLKSKRKSTRPRGDQVNVAPKLFAAFPGIEGQGEARMNTHIHTCFTSSCCTPLNTEWKYRAYQQDPEVAFALIKMCGREVSSIGSPFRCPMPGCNDTKPSAAFYLPDRSPDSIIVLNLFHECSGEKTNWSQPEVYAAHVTRKAWELTGPAKMTWWIRALVDLKYLDLPKVENYPLPAGAPESAHKLYDGFCLLVAVRILYKRDQGGTPFSWRFAAHWCGIGSSNTVKNAMGYLLQRGFLYRSKRGRDGGPKGALQSDQFRLGIPNHIRKRKKAGDSEVEAARTHQ